jgi:hypothetical protein
MLTFSGRADLVSVVEPVETIPAVEDEDSFPVAIGE